MPYWLSLSKLSLPMPATSVYKLLQFITDIPVTPATSCLDYVYGRSVGEVAALSGDINYSA
jgi:hypothetical protein